MFRVLFTLGFLSLESEQKQTPGNNHYCLPVHLNHMFIDFS